MLVLFSFYDIFPWDSNFIKISVFWFFTWALVVFINLNDFKDVKHFKNTIFKILGFGAIIAFVTNLYIFPLWTEMLMIPFVSLLILLKAVSETKKEWKIIHDFLNYLIAIVGIVILIINLYMIIVNFNDFANIYTLQKFLLPILLSLAFLPFLYVLSKYSKWESGRSRRSILGERSIKN
ncbi:MAG: hypothetical protein PHQ01_04180 [Candidatus Pacebacteria bacterium]|nr:hypothetical protein [Candidatus Paceibacterota bacterium]